MRLVLVALNYLGSFVYLNCTGENCSEQYWWQEQYVDRPHHHHHRWKMFVPYHKPNNGDSVNDLIMYIVDRTIRCCLFRYYCC